MNLLETIRIALGALASNKLRAILTMLGIIIGVAAVIALMAVGKGAQQKLTDQVGGLGSNLVLVFPGNQNQTSATNVAKNGGVLTLDDANALARNANTPHVVMVAPQSSGSAQVAYGKKDIKTTIIGTTPEYAQARNLNVPDGQGQWFTRKDVDTRANVALIGPDTADSLFNGANPVGRPIRINGIVYRVVGVVERKGGSPFGSTDGYVYIPITNMQTKLFAARYWGIYGRSIGALNIAVDDAANVQNTIEGVTQVLRQRHKILRQQDDFTVISQSDILSFLTTLTTILTFFLGAIAGISLLVGGIGIMNIMLVSVTERTREIGLRKAVGAKRRDILTQFLVEAIVLSVIGGLIGIGLGSLIGKGVELSGIIAPQVTVDAVALAVGFSIAVGLFFGIYPAQRASRLNPIDALRYE
ncbi:MAG: hypothetical protein DLM69_11255 [Candidatus Chloroheliales bacterium]|nr:MAG: hypothetical protein DLM69_11255 [Chloroflexota bacterium]